MKFIKPSQFYVNPRDIALIMFFSMVALPRNYLYAQNTSLINTPNLMNNTAGEINEFNIFHIVANPANLNSLKKFNIGIYGETKFNLIELSNHIIVSGFSFGKIKMGLQVQQAGSTKFNQHSLGVSLSKEIGNNTSLAIQSKLLQSNFSKHLNQKYISAEIGFITHLSKFIRLGLKVDNYMSYNKQTILDNAYFINICTGVFYQISNQFSMNINCFKTSNASALFSGSMKYQLHKKFTMKLGFVSNTNASIVDISYSGKKMNLALIMAFHPILGITPATFISTVND